MTQIAKAGEVEMSVRGYILIRTIEQQVYMAERNGMNEIWMTTGFVSEIIAVLKEQESKIQDQEQTIKFLKSEGIIENNIQKRGR